MISALKRSRTALCQKENHDYDHDADDQCSVCASLPVRKTARQSPSSWQTLTPPTTPLNAASAIDGDDLRHNPGVQIVMTRAAISVEEEMVGQQQEQEEEGQEDLDDEWKVPDLLPHPYDLVNDFEVSNVLLDSRNKPLRNPGIIMGDFPNNTKQQNNNKTDTLCTQ